ncbi:hypothetical protein RvY_06171 [Ramazzottius varieornatus]|uniref:C2 domain-containing protein n=1 Tax=Ramazzottius varieornatus TaxID=947166 RepID=A0A1D1UY58_RAMVA|nr:hypothetical protein RvY_06171 [Ramazzottius varieornatus]
MRKFDKGTVSAPAVVGLVLSCTLFLVCSVLTIMSVLRRLRKRRTGGDMKSPSTDIQIAVLEKGLGVHQPPTQRRRVQKTLKPAHIGSPTEQTITGEYSSKRQGGNNEAADYSPTGTGGDENWEDSEGEYEDDFEDAESFGGEMVDETEALTKVKVEKEEEVATSPFGTLHFSVKYNFEKNALTVTILKCEQLKSATAAGASTKTMDPYVKLQLLPDKLHRAKTRVLRNTNSPVYNEEFTFFGLSYNQLQAMVLHFAVISFDRYSRDEVLGEVLSPLSMIDLTQSDQESSLVKDIQGRQKAGSQNRGEVLLSLCYQPATNRLTCVILKAKGISRKNIMDLADPYMKLYLIVKGQRIAKKKTLVKPQTLNPVFNQSFVFDLPPSVENLEGVSLELLLLDFDRLTKNEVLGRLELGPQAVEDSARTQWADIASSPRRQIAHWHKLTQ